VLCLDAGRCQPVPDLAYSHSIVNEPFLDFNINDLIIWVSDNTMGNTMIKNSCVGITQGHSQVAVVVMAQTVSKKGSRDYYLAT
jgi:hypothetical protein